MERPSEFLTKHFLIGNPRTASDFPAQKMKAEFRHTSDKSHRARAPVLLLTGITHTSDQKRLSKAQPKS